MNQFSPNRKVSSSNDGNMQCKFRISIPSTRAASREMDNPLAMDSLKLYADQIKGYYPELTTFRENGYDEECLIISGGSDESSGTPYSNEGTMSSSSTFSSFENSTSTSDMSYQSCKSEFSQSSQRLHGDAILKEVVESGDESICRAGVPIKAHHSPLPSTSEPVTSSVTVDNTSPYHNHVSKFNLNKETSQSSVENTSPKPPLFTDTTVSLIVPFSSVSPCSCLLVSAITSSDRENSGAETPANLIPLTVPYKVTTLDAEQLEWMHLQVRQFGKPIASSESHDKESENLQRSHNNLKQAVDWFHSHVPGFPMGINEQQSTVWANVSIYVNLMKPVKLALNRVRGRCSPLSLQLAGLRIVQEDKDNQEAGTPQWKNLSMFLPRGTCKHVHLHSDTTAGETVRALLDNLFIRDLPHKFALYEHCIVDGEQILVSKLSNQSPVLCHILGWATQSSVVSVTDRRLVLQEDEPTTIEWSQFSLPELYNFLRILDMEERQYRATLHQQFALQREFLVDTMERWRAMHSDAPQNAQHTTISSVTEHSS